MLKKEDFLNNGWHVVAKHFQHGCQLGRGELTAYVGDAEIAIQCLTPGIPPFDNLDNVILKNDDNITMENVNRLADAYHSELKDKLENDILQIEERLRYIEDLLDGWNR